MISPPFSGRHSGRATPSCVPPRKRQTTSATGRGSTYPARNPVQTKPATSHRGIRLSLGVRLSPLRTTGNQTLVTPIEVGTLAGSQTSYSFTAGSPYDVGGRRDPRGHDRRNRRLGSLRRYSAS